MEVEMLELVVLASKHKILKQRIGRNS